MQPQLDPETHEWNVKLQNQEITGHHFSRFEGFKKSFRTLDEFKPELAAFVSRTNCYSGFEINQSQSPHTLRLLSQSRTRFFINSHGFNFGISSSNLLSNYKILNANFYAKLQPFDQNPFANSFNNSFTFSVPLNLYEKKNSFLLTLFNINRFDLPRFSLKESLKGIELSRNANSFSFYYKNSLNFSPFRDPDQIVTRFILFPSILAGFKLDLKLGIGAKKKLMQKFCVSHYSENSIQLANQKVLIKNSGLFKVSNEKNIDVKKKKNFYKFSSESFSTAIVVNNFSQFGISSQFLKLNSFWYLFFNGLGFQVGGKFNCEWHYGIGVDLWQNANLILQSLFCLEKTTNAGKFEFLLKFGQ